MKKQYQNPDTFTMSFSVDDIVMGAALNNSVADAEPNPTPLEQAPRKIV